MQALPQTMSSNVGVEQENHPLASGRPLAEAVVAATPAGSSAEPYSGAAGSESVGAAAAPGCSAPAAPQAPSADNASNQQPHTSNDGIATGSQACKKDAMGAKRGAKFKRAEAVAKGMNTFRTWCVELQGEVSTLFAEITQHEASVAEISGGDSRLMDELINLSQRRIYLFLLWLCHYPEASEMIEKDQGHQTSQQREQVVKAMRSNVAQLLKLDDALSVKERSSTHCNKGCHHHHAGPYAIDSEILPSTSFAKSHCISKSSALFPAMLGCAPIFKR